MATASSLEHVLADSICKHYINVSKALAHGSSVMYNFSVENDKPHSDKDTYVGSEKNTIEVFPNPAKSTVTILYPESEFSLIAYDVFGRPIFSNDYFETATIRTSQWQNGMYILEIQNTNTKKISKRKLLIAK